MCTWGLAMMWHRPSLGIALRSADYLAVDGGAGNPGEGEDAALPAFFCQKRVGKDGKLFTCRRGRLINEIP